MSIRNRTRPAISLLLAFAALLVALNACGGTAGSGPTATVAPTAVPTRAVSPTATTVPAASPSPTATKATATSQAAPTATPTRAAATTPPGTALSSATPTRAASPTAAIAASPTAASTAISTPQPASTSTPASAAPIPIIDVDITSDPYLFIPETITFQAGKTYTLRFKPQKEPHTFTVAGLGVNIFINAGETVQEKVAFTDIGTYKLVCVIHEQLGQIGKVIVAPGP